MIQSRPGSRLRGGQSTMRILVLADQFYRLSGAERLSVELAEGLNSRSGTRADLASIYRSDLPGTRKAESFLRDRGIKNIHYLGLSVHPGLFAFSSAVRKLRSLLRENEYDIVETSLASPAILASWASRGLPTRHVAGLHDVFSRDRHRNPKIRFWLFSVRHNRAVRFYAISDFARERWIEFSGTPPAFTRTVYNGIPDDCFNVRPERETVRRELGIPTEGRIALFVGRLLQRKGIDTILDALGPILEERNLYLAYVGDDAQTPEGFFPGEDGLLERMREKIAREGWDRRVKFLGRRPDVPRLLASSDLLVHPARIEGFGLVLAEALAAGLPVAASDVQGIPEVLKNSGSLMVPPDHPRLFREAVIKVLDRSPGEARRIALTGRERAEYFHSSRRIDDLLLLFQDILAGQF